MTNPSVLAQRIIKLGYSVDDSFNLDSLLISDLHIFDGLKGTAYELSNMLSINLMQLSSIVSKYKIDPIEKVQTKGGVGYKHIYSASQFIKICQEHNLYLTLPTSAACRLLREHSSAIESKSLSQEIESKIRRLRDIEGAISNANKRLELAHHKLKYQAGDELLGHEEILVMAGIKRRICGVYFLIKDCEVIYVGQSVNIHSRIDEHDRVKDFDTFTYIECEKENLSYLEARYISKFKPKLNYDSKGRLVLPLRIAA